MQRTIWAFIAFNIYSFFLVGAIEDTTPYIFDPALISQTNIFDRFEAMSGWAWKDHYIWRLFAGTVATAIAAFLAGAIAQQQGGRVAAIANIPSVIVLAATLYFMIFGGVDLEAETGFIFVFCLAIPFTTWIAYKIGALGTEIQSAKFKDNGVLGVHPYHWAWIVFPLTAYTKGITIVSASAVKLFTQRYMGVLDILRGCLVYVAVAAWIAPIVLSYLILAGAVLDEKRPGIKALAITGVIIGGVPVAILVQSACFWLLTKI